MFTLGMKDPAAGSRDKSWEHLKDLARTDQHQQRGSRGIPRAAPGCLDAQGEPVLLHLWHSVISRTQGSLDRRSLVGQPTAAALHRAAVPVCLGQECRDLDGFSPNNYVAAASLSAQSKR